MPEALQEAGLDSFEQVMQLQGKVYRNVPGRKTIRVNVGAKSYFVKQHFGVGWGEIVKNLASFKLPILGAMTEVSAIQKLDEIGIATTSLVAYGRQGCNPASIRSFVMTEDLGDIVSLEELCADWQSKPAQFKQNLIQAIAQLAAKLQSAGLCHRDFYLCHVVIKKAVLKKQGVESKNLNLHLIDLHRMLQGQNPNSSAVMKDVAGLFFSMKQNGFSAQDLEVFKQHYLPQTVDFWQQVEARSEALYSKFNSEKFQKRLAEEKSVLD
jgi:UDP-glucose:(heptosyl)LPS alpha-1,3-glucosyltransferase/heptose I phosphotransferase